MSDLLPIVPGCLCLVIGADIVRENIGKIVKAERIAIEGEQGPIAPFVNPYPNSTCWFVTGDIAGATTLRRVFSGAAYVRERNLMRIDGYKKEEENTEELLTIE